MPLLGHEVAVDEEMRALFEQKLADKNKIKYIAYTAPEPYRSVYLGYVDSYEVGSFGGKIIWSEVDNNQYYKYTDRTYFVDTLTAFAEDPRGEYTTWFHESGHATDCNAQTGLWKLYGLYFSTYNETMGGEVTLQDAIYYDVYNNIEEKIDNYTYWYHKDGNATRAQSKELFAEYFSYYMTGNENAINSMRQHLPVACEVLDEMFETIKSEIEQ